MVLPVPLTTAVEGSTRFVLSLKQPSGLAGKLLLWEMLLIFSKGQGCLLSMRLAVSWNVIVSVAQTSVPKK
jgi:hypothetical protein